MGRILAVGTTSTCQPFLHFVVIVREDEDDELISFCMPLIAAARGPPWSSVRKNKMPNGREGYQTCQNTMRVVARPFVLRHAPVCPRMHVSEPYNQIAMFTRYGTGAVEGSNGWSQDLNLPQPTWPCECVESDEPLDSFLLFLNKVFRIEA